MKYWKLIFFRKNIVMFVFKFGRIFLFVVLDTDINVIGWVFVVIVIFIFLRGVFFFIVFYFDWVFCSAFFNVVYGYIFK